MVAHPCSLQEVGGQQAPRPSLSLFIINVMNNNCNRFYCQVADNSNATTILFIHNPWMCNRLVLLLRPGPLIGSDSWSGSIGRAPTQAEWQSVPGRPFQLSLPWEMASPFCSRILMRSNRRSAGRLGVWVLPSCWSLQPSRNHFPVIFSVLLSFAGDSHRHCRACMKPINKAQTKAECQRCRTGSKVTH